MIRYTAEEQVPRSGAVCSRQKMFEGSQTIIVMVGSSSKRLKTDVSACVGLVSTIRSFIDVAMGHLNRFTKIKSYRILYFKICPRILDRSLLDRLLL